jgi:myosin-crossreactive antigen
VKEADRVIVTLGSMTEGRASAAWTTPPSSEPSRTAVLDLGEDRKGRPEFGRPAAFADHIDDRNGCRSRRR